MTPGTGTLFVKAAFMRRTGRAGDPIAALLAVGGAALLRSRRSRGMSRATVATAGVIAGGIIGAGVLPLCVGALGPLRYGSPLAVLDAKTYRADDFAVGSVTGIILGVASSVLVGRHASASRPAPSTAAVTQ
jgi:hypothetical protein